mmetsp:Transcript_8825/g.12503  ORF Transcript_8825/g.12503 Transcript_8825/m.12503 type:complete len:310 (+) Transcript_8825:187-1116(+)
MQYSQLDEESGDDSVGLTINGGDNEQQAESSSSSKAPKSLRSNNRVNPDLSEPLTSSSNAIEIDDSEDDPFYVFREDLYRKLELVDEGLSRYLRIVHQTDTAVNTHDLKDAKKQLKRHIKNAESTLRDVQTTIQLVSTSRDRFPNITDSELYDRKTLVTTSQDRLSSAKADMNSDKIKQKLMTDERAKAMRRMQQGAADDQKESEEDELIADSHAKTSLLMQQQDETLDELDEAVTRVGTMAGSIHEELGQQNKMLNELEDDLADAEEKLGLVMGKLGKMLKTKDKCQIGTILALCFTVLILFFLVIYT